MQYRLSEINITEFRDIGLDLGYSVGQIVVFYIILFSSVLLFPLWVLFWSWEKIFHFMDIVVTKADLLPKDKLIWYWNDKPIHFRTTWTKEKKD